MIKIEVRKDPIYGPAGREWFVIRAVINGIEQRPVGIWSGRVADRKAAELLRALREKVIPLRRAA